MERKFLYVHRTQGTGVERVHIDGIIRAMAKLGYKARTLSPAGTSAEGSSPGTSGDRAAEPGRWLGWISKWSPAVLFECFELLGNLPMIKMGLAETAKVPVEFIYERYAIFGLAGLCISRRRKTPLLLEVNYTSVNELVRKRTRLLKPLAFWLEKRLFNHANGIAVVSQSLEQQLIDLYAVDPHKICVTPNGCDLEIFPGMEADEPVPELAALEGKQIIGFVGGFYPWHGLDLLVRAFGSIHEQFPDAALLLIGDGPERETVETVVSTMGLSDSVFLTGRVQHERLPAYISLFTVAVMPDSNNYGSPMKLFEYMAMEKPYVAPDYSPILEITEGQGKIFRKKDLESLSEALSHYLSDTASIATDGARGRLLIEEKYNWVHNSKKVLEFI